MKQNQSKTKTLQELFADNMAETCKEAPKGSPGYIMAEAFFFSGALSVMTMLIKGAANGDGAEVFREINIDLTRQLQRMGEIPDELSAKLEKLNEEMLRQSKN